MKGNADRGEGTLLELVQVFLVPFRSLPTMCLFVCPQCKFPHLLSEVGNTITR